MSEPESAAEDIAANDAAEVGNAGETAAEGEIAAATGDASSEANAEPGTRTPQPEDAAGVEATSAENPESDQGQGADGGEKAAANESQTHGASATDAGDDVGDAQAAPGATEDYDAGPSAIDVVDTATEQQDSAASPPDGDAPEDAQQPEGSEEATTESAQAAQQAAESVDSDAATVAAAEDQVERAESEDGATESATDEKGPGEDGEKADEGEANDKEEEPTVDTDAAVPPAQQTGATEEVKTINRDEISQKIMHMTQEADMAATLCLKEQQKIAEYLRTKKRGDDGKQLKHQQQLSQTEETTRFIKYLEMLEDIKSAQLHQKRLYEAQLLGLQSEVHDLRTQLSDEMSALKEKRRYVALHSFSSATGKPLKLDDLEAYEVDEWMKEDEVRRIRLETIRQRIKLAKREAVLQQHEVLPDGTCLNIIDFEQLKVENASLFETTESRSADVKRLEGKISLNVNTMSHIREKESSVQLQNIARKEKLTKLDTGLSERRDRLNKIKKRRDQLRIENQRLKEDNGLLGNTTLLQDFAGKQDDASRYETDIRAAEEHHRRMGSFLRLAREEHIAWYEAAIPHVQRYVSKRRTRSEQPRLRRARWETGGV